MIDIESYAGSDFYCDIAIPHPEWLTLVRLSGGGHARDSPESPP